MAIKVDLISLEFVNILEKHKPDFRIAIILALSAIASDKDLSDLIDRRFSYANYSFEWLLDNGDTYCKDGCQYCFIEVPIIGYQSMHVFFEVHGSGSDTSQLIPLAMFDSIHIVAIKLLISRIGFNQTVITGLVRLFKKNWE